MRAISIVLLVAGFCFCAVAALPTTRSEATDATAKDEVEFVPRGTSLPPTAKRPAAAAESSDSDDDEPAFHVDAIYTPDFSQGGYNPFYNSDFGNFGIDFGFAQRIQDIIRRLYSRPSVESELGIGDDSDELHSSLVPILNTGLLVPSALPVDKQGEDKTETTSTVKIINGHKYVINDTVTTKNTRFGQSVFKVRTVDILPLDDEDTDASSTGATPAKEDEPTSTAAPLPSTTTSAQSDEHVDRGSPEVLESESHNEISHNIDDTLEVLKKKANRSDKIVQLV